MLYIIKPGDVVRCHTESLHETSYIAQVAGINTSTGYITVKTFDNDRLHIHHTDVVELIKIGYCSGYDTKRI